MCREACGAAVYHERREKVDGTNDGSIQINEASFAGRGIQNGDNAPLFKGSDAEQRNNKNYGRKIDRPWVFGFKQGSNYRYFCVTGTVWI